MKVLAGTGDWTVNVRCPCGALLEVEKKDCIFVENMHNQRAWTFKCPQCKCRYGIKPEKIQAAMEKGTI